LFRPEAETVLQLFLGSLPSGATGEDNYILTPGATSTVNRLVSSVSTYIETPGSSSTEYHPVAASSHYVLGPGATSNFSLSAFDHYILTPNAVGNFQRSVSASSGYIFTPGVSGGKQWPVSALSTYIETQTAIEFTNFLYHRSAESDYVFTVSDYCYSNHTYIVSAESDYVFTASPNNSVTIHRVHEFTTYILTPEPSSTVDRLVSANDTYVFSQIPYIYDTNRYSDAQNGYVMQPLASGIVLANNFDWLGRFRRGDFVPISRELDYVPDLSPIAVIVGNNSNVVAVVELPRTRDSINDFFRELLVTLNFAYGNYQVVFRVVVNGVQQTQRDTAFEVIPGGDAGSRVISLCYHEHGTTRAVLAHLASGELVLGFEPSI
jgi:hypothetical protein